MNTCSLYNRAVNNCTLDNWAVMLCWTVNGCSLFNCTVYKDSLKLFFPNTRPKRSYSVGQDGCTKEVCKTVAKCSKGK